MVRSFFMVSHVQGLFFTLSSRPRPPQLSFSSSSSSSLSPTPTPTPTPTVHTITFHTITFYMPGAFSETIFVMLYTQTSIGIVLPIAAGRSAGCTLISNGDSWHFETSDDPPLYFYEDCELTNSNALIQLSPSSSDEIGLLCDPTVEVGRETNFSEIRWRFSDVVKESSTTSENSIAEATRASNGSNRSFGDTGGNYLLLIFLLAFINIKSKLNIHLRLGLIGNSVHLKMTSFYKPKQTPSK
ncbi:hypothetical protein K435DRAFT_791270 [Dendrothele bispora CBS 962.96]|uniref:Uncharacterized protein n=1 Tax=Dendrothele bispora (strain CBS 962.96) TaxID=1314807 RepID=A0A4V4HHU2_DENBC|nr:hypothetical protein K435DRAFT_791270 [Dendrothele bispora CBS 962.96]